MLFEATTAGLRFHVKLTPKGGANALRGTDNAPDGGLLLKAAVTAAPEDGKANDALIRLLSASWNLPKSAFSITSGGTSRLKTLIVAGNPQTLLQESASWPTIAPVKRR